MSKRKVQVCIDEETHEAALAAQRERDADNDRRLRAELEFYAEKMAAAAAYLWREMDGAGGGVLQTIAKYAGTKTPFDLAMERKPDPARKATISRSLRTAVFERDGYACVKCGVQRDLEADHIIPESKGGPTTFENLQTLCRPHNRSKGAKLEQTP